MAVAKNVMLVIRNSAEAHFILPFARAIANGSAGQVHLRSLAHHRGAGLWRDAGPSDRFSEPAWAKMAGNHGWQEALAGAGVRDTSMVEVLEEVNRTPVDLLLLPWPYGRNGPDAELLEVLEDSSCAVGLVRPGAAPPLRRLLVALRGGPSAALALETGLALARGRSCQITVLHAVPHAPRAQSATPFNDLRCVVRSMPLVDQVRGLREPASMSILAGVPGHDVLVMAATTQAPEAAEILDDVALAVLGEAHCTVLVVRARRPAMLPFPLTHHSSMTQAESSA
jgi:nucleotide-binding universal stress UspA family protein